MRRALRVVPVAEVEPKLLPALNAWQAEGTKTVVSKVEQSYLGVGSLEAPPTSISVQSINSQVLAPEIGALIPFGLDDGSAVILVSSAARPSFIRSRKELIVKSHLPH